MVLMTMVVPAHAVSGVRYGSGAMSYLWRPMDCSTACQSVTDTQIHQAYMVPRLDAGTEGGAPRRVRR